ncbi:MAG: diguanylate cyclase [Candidatus Atribacteria bacterium]
MNILPFLHFFAFLVYSYLLVFVLWKDPKSWLNRVCAALIACFAIWSFGNIFIYTFNISKDTAILFGNVGSIGWISFASIVLWFFLIFTEKKKILKSKLFYLFIFILPLLFIYKQWTGFLIADRIKESYGWAIIWSESIWAYLFYLYYLSFMGVGLYLILNFGRKTEEPLKKKQAGIIFVIALIPLILGTLTNVILPKLNILTIPSLGNVIALIWAGGLVYIIAKYKLMIITLAAAADNIISTMADSLVLLDREGNIASVNKSTLDLSGYGKDELKEKSVEIFLAEKNFKSTLLDRAIKKETIRNYELNFKTKTGDNIPVIFSSSIVMDEAGGMAGIVCIIKDITELKQNEKLHVVLYNISKAANSPISLGQLYKTIHQELSIIIDTTNFYIALVDEKEDKIFFPYNIDNTKPIHLPRTINHNSLVAQVIRTGKSIFVNQEMIKGKKFMEEFKEWFGMLRKVWLGVPLKIEDKVIGAMVVQSYTNLNLYTEKDIKLMEFVSEQIATAIDRKKTEERIKHLSFHDSLTGLYNRAYFEEELERYNFPRYYPLSIVIIDINGLKVINDTFGHNQGDKLLQHFAQLLTSVSRKGDIIARIGGDEFALLLPSTTSEQAHKFCERIKKTCEEDKTKPVYLRPSISLGHATQEGEYQNIEILLKEADNKMYQDKLFSAQSREKYLLDSFRLILAERDPHTEDHAQRLQELALALGERIGLTEYQLNNIKLLALLHDIGKIGIPDSILFKTYILTPSEWKKMKEHPKIGYRMAKNIPDFVPIAREILYHHEHWDGNGYPEGLKGEKIPILSRIIAVVDAYDVMQSRRPYKGAVSKTKALKEIKRGAGTQFDPQLVDIFLKIVKNKKNHLKNVRPSS